VYVDASYEGDLLPRFGVPFAVGRESRELYGERWAGRQPAHRPGKHNFAAVVSPFAEDGSLLPHVREPELDEDGWPTERLGAGDGALQAYQFRVCLTNRPENRVPFPEPDGFDASEFALLDRYLAVEPDTPLLGLVPDLLPNGKCDVNSIGPFSLNVLDGSNRDYLDGDREAVRAHHLRYTQALLFFLAQARPDMADWASAQTSSRTAAAGRTSSTSATVAG
ncbi:MAG: FAD-dependent oxidoreductase, partial [Actinobacteria bacterium]|nr:FAD-dependent oxidoreductase [Actinomycetota bacterium]